MTMNQYPKPASITIPVDLTMEWPRNMNPVVTQPNFAKNIAIEDSGAHFTSDNVEDALNELFISVGDGKTVIASAITDMGQTASGSDTFAQLAAKIRDISTGAKIKSVQSGSIYLSGSSNRTVVATINEVNLNKSLLFFTAKTYEDYGGSTGQYLAGYFSSNNQITFTRAVVGTGVDLDISYYVVEFLEGMVVQSGLTTMNSSEKLININTVDLSKSWIIATSSRPYSISAPGYNLVKATLLSATQVTLNIHNPSAECITAWFVVTIN